MTSYERSHWRDEAISLRHRRWWGDNCPAVDLDFLLLEFHHGVSVAIIDYKHHAKRNPLQGLDTNTIKALGGLYNERHENLPFIVTRYWPDDGWGCKALPMNDRARQLMGAQDWVPLTERSWVGWLYQLRRVALNAGDRRYLDRLNTVPPPAESEVA